MDATFRPKKSDLYTMLGLLPLFLAWGGFTLWVAAYDPAVRSRPGFAAMALVPFGMAAMCAGSALDHSRSSLTIRGNRVVLRGFRERPEMDLADVAEARWGPGPVVKLRDASSRLKIDLRGYDRPDRERIVAHLHAAIRTEVQHGWNLFAYQTRFGLPEKRTPGPGEVLRTRRDSLRLYLAAVAAAVPVVVAAWWMTGHASTFFVLPVLLAFVLAFAFATPKDGEVAPELSWRATPEVAFILGWAAMGCGLILGFGRLLGRLPIPAALASGTAAAYVAAFVVVMNRFERRRKAREDEAAERAAAERGESGFPSSGARV